VRKKLDPAHMGRWGEDTACAFLRLKGLKILERNYRVGHLEIDIIARDKEELVFVEVKVRCGKDYGGPWGAVDWKKQRVLTRAAAGYLARGKYPVRACRFDVVAIAIDEHATGMQLKHIERAFDISGELGLFF